MRVVLCLFPQNRWLENEGSVEWGIILNVPFVVFGGVDIWLFGKYAAGGETP